MPSRIVPHWPLLLVLLVASGCATTTNYVTGESQRTAYSWAEQVQLGQQADPQIVAQYGLYDDPQLTRYVEQVGQAVLQTSAYTDPNTPAEIRNTPFYFRVLDSPVVNAFALPGGYIYVTRGLLAHLDNEAQLAVVLGHEIGHVLGQHAAEQAASAQLGQLGLLGAAILGEVVLGQGVGQGVLEYGGAAAQLLFLRYSRDAERESDRAGVAYAEFAGYDAAEAATFFRSLQRISAQAGALPSFLSTHPDPAEREQTIPQLAAQYDSGTEVGGPEFLGEIEGIVLGADPRQGFTEGDRFYHPELRFQFDVPRGWTVNNAAAAVTIAEPNNRAVMEFTFAEGASAQAAARAFGQQQGVQVGRQGAQQLNGIPAYAVEGTANTQQGQLAFVAYFIEYGGNVYRFWGLAPAQVYRSYEQAMVRAIRSFAPLRDSQYLNRQPVRLEVVEAPRTAPFQSFLQGRPMPPDMDAEDLAIMNQVELNQQVPAGTALKLPD
ncbi:MAG TPA: M48 family metalloprotease [Rubricoccaceae bacterium]|nr:M48 family metalloprotease [Rubricoccaceae bacterium]